MTAVVTPPVGTASTLLLPERPRRFGPVSRLLLARFAAVVLLVEAAGAALVFGASSTAWRAAGLSLVFPGAGLLYVAAPVAFLGTLVALLVALVLWWGLSTHFAIPLVWAGSAVAAGVLADGPNLWVARGTRWGWAIPVAYALLAAAVGWAVWRVESRFRAKRALVPELNRYLAEVELPARLDAVREPDRMDAELLRWCHDFAFQPDHGLLGLDWGEQFHGGTQLRYQLNSVAWAMSLYAANFLPNAPRRMEEALARVVEKHTDLRVWKYWRTLNLLGNFDPNPDPIRRDNIMFSAFLGDVINTFEAATGSTRFDEPGSLTFVWGDGRTFPYDHHSIAAAVRKNYDRSRLGFFPCEPGWSFTVCNVMGAQALRNHDAIHGSHDWDDLRESWRRALDEEYLTPDGSYAHIRSNHVGLSWDTGEVPGGHYFANGTHRFADILPDHARRARALDLRGVRPKMAALAGMVRDGRLELELPPELERHRTASSPVLPWVKVIGGARMAGEAGLVAAALDASARQCATGERWPGRPVRVGGAGLGSYMLVRWSQQLDLAALNLRGYVAPVGPVVADGDDAVLITFARCDDGRRLDLAFEPVRERAEGAWLALTQLPPGAAVRLHGVTDAGGAGNAADGGIDVTVTADDAGRATVSLPPIGGPVRATVEAVRDATSEAGAS